jgi:hypothetical protein
MLICLAKKGDKKMSFSYSSSNTYFSPDKVAPTPQEFLEGVSAESQYNFSVKLIGGLAAEGMVVNRDDEGIVSSLDLDRAAAEATSIGLQALFVRLSGRYTGSADDELCVQ